MTNEELLEEVQKLISQTENNLKKEISFSIGNFEDSIKTHVDQRMSEMKKSLIDNFSGSKLFLKNLEAYYKDLANS
jgi:hypothetical protein